MKLTEKLETIFIKILFVLQVDKFMPEFYKSILVGDNFFLNLAVMNMGFRMSYEERTMQSGYCVSGLTIEQAIIHVESMSPNQLIMLNIGSADIAMGKELIDLIYGMLRLLRACKVAEVTPILTTLLPMLNYRQGHRASVMNEFNEFLVKNPFNFPVIQLHNAFYDHRGILEQQCYQALPRHVSGMRNSLVFWSGMGRQRVMKILTREIGSAILKILIK